MDSSAFLGGVLEDLSWLDWSAPETIATYGTMSAYFGLMFACLIHALYDTLWSTRKKRMEAEVKAAIARRCESTEMTAEMAAVAGSWSMLVERPMTTPQKVFSIATRVILILFGLASFVQAWVHIVAFLQDEWSRAGKPRWAQWVVDADLFVGAYRQVVGSAAQWWWTSTLLQGVGTIAFFTYVESIRCGGLRPASSFLLGCFAAISLSFPLLVAAISNTPRRLYERRFRIRFSPLVFFSGVLATAATMLLPFASHGSFGPLLYVLHITLLLPLIVAQFDGRTTSLRGADPTARVSRHTLVAATVQSLWVPMVYMMQTGLSFSAYLRNSVAVVDEHVGQDFGPRDTIRRLKAAFRLNPCQVSISGDVVLTSVVVLATMALLRPSNMPWLHVAALALATPVLSFSVTLPLFLALREYWMSYWRIAVSEKIALRTESLAASRATTPVPGASPAAVTPAVPSTPLTNGPLAPNTAPPATNPKKESDLQTEGGLFPKTQNADTMSHRQDTDESKLMPSSSGSTVAGGESVEEQRPSDVKSTTGENTAEENTQEDEPAAVQQDRIEVQGSSHPATGRNRKKNRRSH